MAGRLTRSARIQRTKIQNKVNNVVSAGKPFTHADELNFITASKQVIMDHPATTKSLIGAKDTGKNRMINVRAIREINSDKDSYMVGMRKYKNSVKARVANAMRNMSLEIQAAGYNVCSIEHSNDKSYFIRDKHNKVLNQSMEFAGFDDINGIAGIEAPNLGKFVSVEIDEPVLANDTGKIPTVEEWENNMSMLRDSIDRSNRRYQEVKKLDKAPKCNWYLAMNPWDDHPEVLEAEKYFPEEEFLEWVLKDMRKNSIQARYNKEKDKLYVRFTKFSNPTLDFDKLEEEVKAAIEANNRFELTRLLGLKSEPVSSDPKVLRMENIKVGDTAEMLKDKEIVGFSGGWDIDINRKLVYTPTVVAGKKDLFGRYDSLKIYVLPQITVPAYGRGVAANKIYVESMEEISIENLKKYKPSLKMGKYTYFDENKTEWSYVMSELRSYPYPVCEAVKHGHWDRQKRVDKLQILIDLELIVFDSKNKTLIHNLESMTRKEGSDVRDESGSKEKLYDEINSLEYAIYPWRGITSQIYAENGITI